MRRNDAALAFLSSGFIYNGCYSEIMSPLSFLNRIFGPGGEAGRIGAEELKDLLEDGAVTLIDVRTREEHNACRIPGSVHMPLDTLSSLKAVPYRGRIVVYCAAGVRSRKACGIFLVLGARDVVDLRGGIRAWLASGGDYITGGV